MCNGESGRQSIGGTIAVLKAPGAPSRPPLRREVSLQLTEDSTGDGTIARLQGEGNPGLLEYNGCHFVIQCVFTLALPRIDMN